MIFKVHWFNNKDISSLMKRRRRDLNPRAAINDLHPFQGCPFNHLGTSPNKLTPYILFYFTDSIITVSGEDGIRTHAPLRTNGFQDRLVMTTSIPLRGARPLTSAKPILTKKRFCVNNFFLFFSFFCRQFFYRNSEFSFSICCRSKRSSGVVILRFR